MSLDISAISDGHITELGGLFGSQVGEVAGDQIIGLAGGHEVQGHHGELLGGAALEKADLILFGHVQHPAHGGLGLLEDGIKDRTAMTHLHNRLAG